MALADMYKQNNVTYYESGHGMSGVFSDTIENLTADGMIDDSIFLNTGSTWTMKNTGNIGNHFAWYADWVGGVLAVRKGPDVISITYLGSAILSKNTSCVIANLSAKQADGAGWANFKNTRFMIDAVQTTPGTASKYNAFNYAAYSGQKYGFNSCFIESTAGYATSNTAHNYTFINDYTTLTGDNAKRIVYSNYQVMLTRYNPYMADNEDIDKYNVGYIWDFFDIGGEIVCVRDMLNMPNSAHWQSWAYYHAVSDEYITIGGFGDNITAGSQGALPLSDDVKGIFSYNNSGTSANWFTTKNAVDFKTNSMGLRWCVGNTTISTAKQWRDNVRLGVMAASGIITHNKWIVGEAAIQASDNPNKNTDYDHIPAHGGGGGGGDDDDSDDQLSGGIYGGASGMCNLYYMTSAEIKNLQDWFRGSTFSPGIQIPANFDPSTQLIGLMAFPIELGGSITSDTITFRTSDNQAVNTGVSCQKAYGDDLKFDMGTIDIPARMQERGVPFLDYSSQIEVYIPFCDVVQLDVQQVIGTTLKCEMWISPATGDVSAMLSSGTHPVAYTSGSCAQQLPISVGSYGAIAGARLAADNRKSQAIYQAAQNIVKDVTNAGAITSAVSNHTAVNGQGLVEFSRIPQVQSNTGLAVGAGIKAAGDIVNTALSLTATNLDNKYALQVAKNSAPTHVSGSFGACTSWHFPNYCYVKITRPHFKKPDNYGHTEAVPVVATKKLSELSGLTTCVNPDVSGIGTATMQELETIKGYLMSGVIL